MRFIQTVTFSVFPPIVETAATDFEQSLDNTTDSATGAVTGVPGHLADEAQTVFNAQEGRLTTVRIPVAMVPSDTVVSKGSRLKDEATDEVWFVQNVVKPRSPLPDWPIRVELKAHE